jgi:hypothetical protein
MPQLVKGGKWVFGWVIVGPHRTLPIPPQAFEEYGFQIREPVAFLRGSQRSGGFSVGRLEKLVRGRFPLQSCIIDQGEIGEAGLIEIPPAVEIQPGDRLLVVRGSGLALGFIAKGPVYQEALKHPEIETFLEEEPKFTRKQRSEFS